MKEWKTAVIERVVAEDRTKNGFGRGFGLVCGGPVQRFMIIPTFG